MVSPRYPHSSAPSKWLSPRTGNGVRRQARTIRPVKHQPLVAIRDQEASGQCADPHLGRQRLSRRHHRAAPPLPAGAIQRHDGPLVWMTNTDSSSETGGRNRRRSANPGRDNNDPGMCYLAGTSMMDPSTSLMSLTASAERTVVPRASASSRACAAAARIAFGSFSALRGIENPSELGEVAGHEIEVLLHLAHKRAQIEGTPTLELVALAVDDRVNLAQSPVAGHLRELEHRDPAPASGVTIAEHPFRAAGPVATLGQITPSTSSTPVTPARRRLDWVT